MKIKHLLSLSAFSVMSVCAMAQPDGTGAPESPYQIKTAEDFIWFATQICEEGIDGSTGDYTYTGVQPDACAVLCNDIDLAGYEFMGVGYYKYYDYEEVIAPYEGVFDGQNHKITNWALPLWFGELGIELGFFNYIGASGRVKNLFLENVDVVLGTGDAAFAAMNYGTIENCHVTGSVTSVSFMLSEMYGEMENYGVAGFVNMNYGTISNCVSGVTFKGFEDLMTEPASIFPLNESTSAFVVTNNFRGTIENCVCLGAESNANAESNATSEATADEVAAMIATATPVSGIRADKFMGADDRCTVYSISGSVVYSGAASGMKVAKPGIYVVKVGGATRKMYVK